MVSIIFFNRFWINCSSFNLLWKKKKQLKYQTLIHTSCDVYHARTLGWNRVWIIFHNVTYRQTILFLRGRGWLGNFFRVRFFSPLVFAEKFFATYTLAGIFFFFWTWMFFPYLLTTANSSWVNNTKSDSSQFVRQHLLYYNWFQNNSLTLEILARYVL